MLDPRVRYTEGAGYYHYAGKSFPFVVHDRASKQAAYKQLTEWADEVIARREKMAGRVLSEHELHHGVAHTEDRDTRQRIADQNFRVVVTVDAEPADDNPFRDHRETRPTHPSNARREIYAKAEREWDERKESAEAKAAFDNDPRRLKAVAHAEEMLERARFSDVPMSVVVRAEQALRQAKEGDLSAYREMSRTIAAAFQSHHDAKVREVDTQLDRLRQARAELADEFEPEPEPEPEPTKPWETYQPQQYEVRSPEEYERRRQATEEFDKERKAKERREAP